MNDGKATDPTNDPVDLYSSCFFLEHNGDTHPLYAAQEMIFRAALNKDTAGLAAAKEAYRKALALGPEGSDSLDGPHARPPTSEADRALRRTRLEDALFYVLDLDPTHPMQPTVEALLFALLKRNGSATEDAYRTLGEWYLIANVDDDFERRYPTTI